MTVFWTNLFDWLLLSLGGLVILATLLPLYRRGYWWIRLFDFPRLQILIIGAAVLVLVLPTQPLDLPRLALLTALIACLAYQLRLVGPYTPFAATQVIDASPDVNAPRLRLMIANVLMDNRQSQRFLQIVETVDPDVLLVMETDQWWADALAPLESRYANRIEQPQNNTYGMLLYSRLPLRDPLCRFVVEPDVPSFFAQIELGSDQYADLYALHPQPPQPFNDTFERDAELLVVGREVRERARPTIVCGDLNDVAWSATTRLFQRTSGLLDPRRGRGFYSSFNAKIPLFRWPLDHVFHSEHFQVRRLQRLGYFGSDHFPVCVELDFRPIDAHRHEQPSPKPGDHQEIEEKLGEVQSS